jgi:trans-aconitate 2-methyltransferase
VSDWDAAAYRRVAAPQFAWGRALLDRVPATRGIVIDAGCGDGRLTAELAARVAPAAVVAIDRSPAMAALARRALPGHVPVVRADAARLPFRRAAAGIFSAATFHWIEDHPRLFASLHDALGPGGWLVAQFGGAGNLGGARARAERLSRDTLFAPHLDGFRYPTYFAGVEETVARLTAVGFVDVNVTLEPAPTSFPDRTAYAEFVRTVIVRLYLDRLPVNLRDEFLGRFTDEAAADQPPFTLDYVRLNVNGRAGHVAF